jgi:hypothetical protein
LHAQVEQHGEFVDMADVDQRFELVRPALQVGPGEGRQAPGPQQTVNPRQVAVQIGPGDGVAHFRREQVRPVVAQTDVGAEFDNGQRLNRVDSERQDVVMPKEDIQEGSAPGLTEVGA